MLGSIKSRARRRDVQKGWSKFENQSQGEMGKQSRKLGSGSGLTVEQGRQRRQSNQPKVETEGTRREEGSPGHDGAKARTKTRAGRGQAKGPRSKINNQEIKKSYSLGNQSWKGTK